MQSNFASFFGPMFADFSLILDLFFIDFGVDFRRLGHHFGAPDRFLREKKRSLKRHRKLEAIFMDFGWYFGVRFRENSDTATTS